MQLVLIIALIVGGGLTIASEQALPNDTLYPIKVSVNEKVRSTLTLTADARWEARQAERRLEEAEILANKNELNALTRAELEARFEEYVEAFQNRISKIEAEGETRLAFELQSEFEGMLQSHMNVIERIMNKNQNGSGEINPILVKVRTALNAASQSRIGFAAVLVESSGPETETAALGKQKAATSKISEVKDFILKKEGSVEAETAAEAKTKLESAEKIFVRAESELENQNFGKSFASFQESMIVAQDAKIIVAIDAKLKLDSGNTSAEIKMGSKTSAEQSASTDDSDSQSENKENDDNKGSNASKIKIDLGI